MTMKTDSTPWPRFLSFLLAGLFLVAIYLPLAGSLSGMGPGPDLGEKRQIANPPSWPGNLKDWGAYPDLFEKYFNDNFGFRNWLVIGRSLLVLHGWTTHPSVLFDPRSKMLFFRRSDPMDPELLTPPDKKQLARIGRYIRSNNQWLADHDAAYLFAAVPSRLSIYYESHPLGSYLHAHRAFDVLKSRAEVRDAGFVDLLDVLNLHRADPQAIYYRYDTHWTDYGAYLAYLDIISHFNRKGLSLTPVAQTEFNPCNERLKGDMIGLLGLHIMTNFLETMTFPIRATSSVYRADLMDEYGRTIQTVKGDAKTVLNACREARQFKIYGPPSGPRLLVFRDSYTTALLPYLAEQFSEATFVWTYPGKTQTPAWFDRTKPNGVLEIFSEYNVLRL
ncbi:MAG: hypothetical protein V2A34_14475 [Lentisphaerota bacterium]